MISLDEAVALIRASAKPLVRENVALHAAHRRILARAVDARIFSPPADVSAMDGYAVQERDLATPPAQLAVIGESFAGHGFSGILGPGQCVRIFTGAPLPQGATHVIIQENVQREGNTAIFAKGPGPARHIREEGSDFREGDIMLEPGRLLDSRAMVAAAAADWAEVEVWARPRVAILSTGDELAEPGSARDLPGSIPESVSPGVAALAEEWGAQVTGRTRLRDDLATMEAAASAALESVDLVVVTGGASVGERDHAKAMFEPCGLELIFSKVAIKPGKPVWFGRANGRLVIGLPGNPTSALVTARLLAAPLLAGLSGREPYAALSWRQAILAHPLDACGDRETFVRGTISASGVQVIGNQDSGAQRGLAAADLLIRRSPFAPPVEAGGLVEVLDF